MSRNVEINIDMDKKCCECHKPGALKSGLCLGCCSKAMAGKKMKSREGQIVQKTINLYLEQHK